MYSYIPPIQQDPGNYLSSGGVINFGSIPPATNAANAQQEFDSRAAAAIWANAAAPLTSDNTDNGEMYFPYLLAKWAYPEYFNDDPAGTNRSSTHESILNHTAGEEGTKTSDGSHDEYDFTLNFYLPLVYRGIATPRCPAMPKRQDGINHLMGDAVLSGVPTDRPGVGGIPTTLAEYIHIPDIIDLAETANHQHRIETARYLANQLLYQRTQDPNYDNLRNGDTQDGSVHATGLGSSPPCRVISRTTFRNITRGRTRTLTCPRY